MILLAANSILASQQAYDWNVLLETWVDPTTGNVRTVLKTYVTENYTSIDEARRPDLLQSTPCFPDSPWPQTMTLCREMRRRSAPASLRQGLEEATHGCTMEVVPWLQRTLAVTGE